MSDLEAPVHNTPYDDDELEHFEKLLKEQQKETQKEIISLKKSLQNLKENQGDENSAAAHHQGDIASEEDEREKFLIMIEKANNKLDEINAALNRIDVGTYGICEETGQKIQKERLEAIPYARFSMAAKE